MKTLCATIAILKKDLLGELRKKEHLNSLFFFSLLVVFLFSFCLGTDPELQQKMAPGLLWLVVLFSASIALERSFYSELDSGCLDGLILYTFSPRAIFLGKFLSNLLFIMAVQIVVTLFLFFLFDLPTPVSLCLFIVTLLLGDVGLAALGTFYAALTSQTRARQVLLPLLFFPMLTPLLLGAVYATQYALYGDLLGRTTTWLQLMGIFDLIFLTASIMMIEPLFE